MLVLFLISKENGIVLLFEQPTSPVVERLSSTVRIGFSLLNNLLRIESSLIDQEELEARSYLHRVIATPTADGRRACSLRAEFCLVLSACRVKFGP